MRALFEARIEHLSAADRVRIECLGKKMPDGSLCNRVAMIAVTGLGLPGWTRIADLKRRFRCDNCGHKGRVDLSIVWSKS